MAEKTRCCNTCAHCSSVGRLVKYCGRVATVYDCRLTKGEINTWWASRWGCARYQSRLGVSSSTVKQLTIWDCMTEIEEGTENGLQERNKADSTI